MKTLKWITLYIDTLYIIIISYIMNTWMYRYNHQQGISMREHLFTRSALSEFTSYSCDC